MTAKIKLNAASGGGSISIQAPSSSSNNRVIALPDIADGTLVTSESTLDATKLSGALPAISGANLTGISGGKVLQFLQTVKNDTLSTTISNGGQSSELSGLTVSITPANASNKILIRYVLNIGTSSGNFMVSARLRKDNSTISAATGDTDGGRAVVTSGTNIDSVTRTNVLVGEVLDTAGDTNARTYGVVLRHGKNASTTVTINKSESSDDNDAYSFRTISTISAMEIAA